MKCPKCLAEIQDGSPFCPSCGAALTPPQSQAPNQPPNQGPNPNYAPQGAAPQGAAPQAGTGLAPNVAALIAYAFGWISGLIMFFIEKDKFVKFHAMQSIILFGGVAVFYWVMNFVFGMLGIYSFGLAMAVGIINLVLGVGAFALWIILMIKAYKGEKFSLPVIGEMAEKFAEK